MANPTRALCRATPDAATLRPPRGSHVVRARQHPSYICMYDEEPPSMPRLPMNRTTSFFPAIQMSPARKALIAGSFVLIQGEETRCGRIRFGVSPALAAAKLHFAVENLAPWVTRPQ